MPPKKRKAATAVLPPDLAAAADDANAATKKNGARLTRASSRKKDQNSMDFEAAASGVSASATDDPKRRRRGAAVAAPPTKRLAFDAFVCEQWFRTYADEADPDVIDIVGIEKLCAQLDISVDSCTVLALAWKLDAKRMGFFTKQEWATGMAALKADCLEKLAARVPMFNAVFDDINSVKEIFRWAFAFSKDEGRNCDVDIAKAMWRLILKSGKAARYFSHVDSMVDFLDERTPVKAISKDQWMSFLDFSLAVTEDLSSYDENSAWPVLFDEYVEWRRERDA